MVEITDTKQNIGQQKNNEDSLRDLWGNIKCTDVHIIAVPEKRRERKGPKKKFEEIIAENFPNRGKEIVNHVQQEQRVPSRINPERNPLRHTVIKLTKMKHKDKILKETRENNK